jgi:curved DNA-binding protein CbpA
MKLGSKYFDSIRISSKRTQIDKTTAESRHPPCQWKGCEKPGPHRAPKGRGRDGEYFFFCADHVRQYNQSYNYFDGMSDREVADFQKDAITGHRPTWKIGANSLEHGTSAGATNARFMGLGGGTANDPHGVFARRAKMARQEPAPARRKLRPVEKKSLDALNLGEEATREQIKARFKELVKRHHPDANGGDNKSEDRLRDIIQAYNHLKQAGLV